MRYAIAISLFLQQLTLETWGLCVFSAKCDVILRFRRISFNMPQGLRMPRLLYLDSGIEIHTCTAKMSARGGWGELYHYSVFALLEFYWNVYISFFFLASNGSPIQNLVHTNS